MTLFVQQKRKAEAYMVTTSDDPGPRLRMIGEAGMTSAITA